VNLLAFQELPKTVLTSRCLQPVERFGQNSNLSLAAVAQRSGSTTARLRARTELALQVLQAPVFHGYAFSVYVEMEKPVTVADVTRALAGEHVVVSSSPEDAPTNVSAAGQGDILVSISADANQRTACASGHDGQPAAGGVDCVECARP